MDYPFPPVEPTPNRPEPDKPESQTPERESPRPHASEPDPPPFEDESPPVRAIPEGTHTVTPYLIVRGASRAIDFYREAFGAEELLRMPSPDGSMLMHAELEIGDSRVFLADEMPGMGSPSPQTLKATTVILHVYVEDADALFERAIRAGAKVHTPMEDTFWGDRYGRLEDPFGHAWGIATHVEDVSPAEMSRRAAQFVASMPPPPKPPARRKTAAKKKVAKKKVVQKKPARKKVVRKKVAKKKPARKKAAKKTVRKTARKPAKKKVAARKTPAKKRAKKTAVRKVVRKKKPAARKAGRKKVVRKKKSTRRR